MTTAIASPLRRIVLLTCLCLSATLVSPVDGALVTGSAKAPVPLAVSVVSATTPSTWHPYSDPVWSPLRNPARVNCVKTNCPGPYHSYWAIDFIAKLGDPLHAAGAGVFHIGALSPGCTTTIARGGTWVWIDHGAGRTTQYHHLDRVLAREGQLVTPATKIGTIGHSGHVWPCRANYLHMEYRSGGKTGTRIAPGVMQTCIGSRRVSMPSSLGYATWDTVPTNQNPRTGSKPNIYTPSATNACLPTSWTSTPARPVLTGRRGPGSATIGWGAVPASVNRTVVMAEKWHPSLGRYGNPVYRTVIGRASSTRFSGLLNGRPYRYRATRHNRSGYSVWSKYVRVVPAAAPSAPRAPRSLSTTYHSIRYAWWLPSANGTPITRHVVARRCVVSGAWTGWAKTNVAAPLPGQSWTLRYNWTRMPRTRTCQVKVRAVNSAGYGRWSTVTRATTR